MKLRDLSYIFGYTKIVKVDDKLLRGNAVFSPTKIARLKAKNVTQIIDLRDGGKSGSTFLKKLEKFYCKLFNIKYVEAKMHFVQDRIPNEDCFTKITKLIENNNGKSYIHCHYRKHRTGQAIAMYQKAQNVNEKEIMKNLFNCGWNEKSDFTENSYKSLLAFVKKYFPSKENFQKIETQRDKFCKK